MKISDITTTIKKRISDYIEFDVDEIFDQSDFITIFGGSVRDSIAGLDIHDVDILCMSKSAEKLRYFLTHKYNYKSLDLYDIDTINMYKGISLISEPWTLMNENKKIIQIIKPTLNNQGLKSHTTSVTDQYIDAYRYLIKNIDLSCCGVFIEKDFYISKIADDNDGIILKEACDYAIAHCLSKSFKINKSAVLYNEDRTNFREDKLIKRGWTNLYPDYFTFDAKKTNLVQERLVKIIQLELESDYDYKI